MILVLMGTALRIGELLAHDWSDIELLDARLHVTKHLTPYGIQAGTKTGEEHTRTIDLPAWVLEALYGLYGASEGEGPVFRNTRGGRLSIDGAERRFRTMRIQAGLEEMHVHDLRHVALTAYANLPAVTLKDVMDPRRSPLRASGDGLSAPFSGASAAVRKRVQGTALGKRMSPTTWDLDELIASGEIAGDADGARRRLHSATLAAEFFQALRTDPEIMIEIAGEASAAAEKQRSIDEEERAGLASADPAEVARMQRRIVARRRRRNAASAAMTAYDAL